MIYLWRLEKETLVLNLEEILKYDDLAIIYRRDQSADKYMAKREFKYIDFIANRDSYCVENGFSDRESHNFAVEHSGLPKDYKPDKLIVKGVQTSRRLNGGVIEELIDTTIGAFRIDAKIMGKMKKLAQDLFVKATTVEDITGIMDLTKAVIDMSSAIPTKVTKLLELKIQYNDSKSKTSNSLRGGGEIANSYEGDGLEKFSDSGKVETLEDDRE